MTSSPLLSDSGVAPELLAQVQATAASLASVLHPLSTAIHDHPELAWEEMFAHDACTDFMEKQQGWKVTRHAYDIGTAWSAVFDNGPGRVVGFNSEMDALRAVGHACGHNLIAVLGIAAALTTAEAMKKHNIPGKVILLGTPAEEAGGGKSLLLKRGAYDEMDICMMSHPSGQGPVPGHGTGIPNLACSAGFSVKYTGASSHAAAWPEKGVNALDAAVSAYQNLALLRQQIGDHHRVYTTIKGCEKWSANVIAGESSMIVGVRCPTAKETYHLIDRALNCFKAAALATGCKYEIKKELLYFDTQQSSELAKAHQDICASLYPNDSYDPHQKCAAATDFGDVTYKLPALHPMYILPEAGEGDVPHSDTFAQVTGTLAATEASMRSASTLAAVAVRALLDEEWVRNVKSVWERQMVDVDGATMAKALHELMDQYPVGDSMRPPCCGEKE